MRAPTLTIIGEIVKLHEKLHCCIGKSESRMFKKRYLAEISKYSATTRTVGHTKLSNKNRLIVSLAPHALLKNLNHIAQTTLIKD